MAISKSGGTRTYLRGRVANDVYSIGKDSAGNKQQVVRSLAEQVANPQTVAQMRGRMIMSTVMQAVSAMSPIIDHSFDSVPAGQPSISEFIRRNYALIKADVAAHPTSNNGFGLNAYQKKGIMQGNYQLSSGTVPSNENIQVTTTDGAKIQFSLGAEGATAAQVRETLGLSKYEYITICSIANVNLDYGFAFVRLHPSNTLAADTVITKDNFLQLFDIENPSGFKCVATAGTIASFVDVEVAVDSFSKAYSTGIIYTQSKNGKFIHSTCVLSTVAESQLVIGSFPADEVLPTYPEGSQRFLNGGEI